MNTLLKFRKSSLGQHLLVGAGVAFLILNVLLIVTGASYTAWVLWPLSTVTLGGALGGIVFYLSAPLLLKGGWKKTTTLLVCSVLYVLFFWLSLVAALDITGHWD